MTAAIDQISPAYDSNLFIGNNKSGEPLPSDFTFDNSLAPVSKLSFLSTMIFFKKKKTPNVMNIIFQKQEKKKRSSKPIFLHSPFGFRSLF